MLAIDDYAFNQKTRHVGRVIGYGHQMINDVYMPTLKVLITESSSLRKRSFVEEDLYSTWTHWSPHVSS